MKNPPIMITAGLATGLATAAWLGTMFVRIPIPATTGYFNIGDIFVLLAGIWLGPLVGFLVGLFGPTMADALGYPQFILATAIIKSIEGGLAGLIGGRTSNSVLRKWLGSISGGAVMVIGYFVFEAYIYPQLGKVIPLFAVTTYASALVEIVPNCAQAAIGIIISVGVWKSISKINTGRTNELDYKN